MATVTFDSVTRWMEIHNVARGDLFNVVLNCRTFGSSGRWKKLRLTTVIHENEFQGFPLNDLGLRVVEFYISLSATSGGSPIDLPRRFRADAGHYYRWFYLQVTATDIGNYAGRAQAV